MYLIVHLLPIPLTPARIIDLIFHLLTILLTPKNSINIIINFLDIHKKVQLKLEKTALVIRKRHFRETDIIGYKTENGNKQKK